MTRRLAHIALCLSVLLLARSPASAQDDDFVIKKPGEITFTTGIVIEGRIEKPQVMLVLTKERVKIEPLDYEGSFIKSITEPLRLNTFQTYDAKQEGGGESAPQSKRRKL